MDISKRSTQYNIFIFIIISSFSILAIVLVNLITAPIIDARVLKEQLQSYALVMPTIQEYSTLENDDDFKVIQAFGEDNKVLGVLYVLTQTNGYGDLTIISGVNTQGIILDVLFLSYFQTQDFKPISEENLALYKGLHVGLISTKSDFVSGATQSYDSIAEAMMKVSAYHLTLTFESESPFARNLEGFDSIVEDMLFVPTQYVVRKSNIVNANDDIIAHIYKITGTGLYYEGEDLKEISLHVVVGLNDIILDVVIFEDEYLHSKGAFYRRIQTYVSLFIGKDINGDVAYDADWTSGASSGNSKTLVDLLISALVEAIR